MDLLAVAQIVVAEYDQRRRRQFVRGLRALRRAVLLMGESGVFTDDLTLGDVAQSMYDATYPQP